MKLILTALCAALPFLGCLAEKRTVLKGFGDASLYTLNPGYGTIAPDGGSLLVDSSGGRGEWSWSFRTNPGVLKPGTAYVISFRYRVENPDMKNRFFHFLLRPAAAPDSRSDLLRHNEGESAVFRPVKLRFVTGPDIRDYAFQVHMFRQLRGEISDLEIVEYSEGWEKFLPAAADSEPFTGKLENLPKGAGEFEVDLPRNSAGASVDASRFGVAEENPDNVPALNRALEFCRKSGAARLTVKKGAYRMTSDAALLLDGMKDFEFDGGGSVFVFCKQREPDMKIRNCERVALRNFSFDWDWEADPLASIVRVRRSDRGSAEFEFIEYDRFPRRDSRIAYMSSYDPAAGAVGVEGGVDRSFELFAGRGNRPQLAWLSDNVLQVKAPDMHVFRPGEYFRIQHYYYDMPAVVMTDNRHLTLEDVNIYSCAGHAFTVGGTQQYWQFRRVRIVKPENAARRAITCTADHCHISRSRGFFKMEECEFSFGSDDGLNAHDNAVFAVKAGPRSVRTRNIRGIEFFRPGDAVELRHGDYSSSGFRSQIESVREIDAKAGEYEITFAASVPDPLAGENGFVVFNWNFDTRNIIVRNSYFHDNRCRGILILARDMTIENCRFRHHPQGALKIESGYTFNSWSEGYGVDNVVVRNCRFDSVNTRDVVSDGKARDIYMGVYMKTDPSNQRTDYPVLSNILFENNTFKDSFGLVAFVSSAGKVTFRNNTFLNPSARKRALPYRGGFFVTNASDVTIVNNRYVASPHVPNPGVWFDEDTVKNLVVQGNRVEQEEAAK
ncbi:MAG: right-handed parallel beta-helix repeat-containing protein [Lentisphaeria bacterium]|nr:right-handed parallel beta-helix repeat-containing protein [Lentisphaeria bacterium]